MSAVIAVPELMAGAATDLAAIGSTLNAAHLIAAPPTLGVPPAAADEVSTAIAHLFSEHAQDYQRLAGKAAAFQEQFVQHLTASASTYAGAEAADVALLQPFNAIAGSIGGAVAALPGQAVTLFNAVGSQQLNLLTTARGALVAALTPALALLAVILLIAIFLTAIVVIQLLDGAGFSYLFGLL